MNGRGLSTRDISESIKNIYDVDLSTTMISNITDALLEEIKEWIKIYPINLRVWEDNWEVVCTLFNYSKELRKIMYTTNAI